MLAYIGCVAVWRNGLALNLHWDGLNPCGGVNLQSSSHGKSSPPRTGVVEGAHQSRFASQSEGMSYSLNVDQSIALMSWTTDMLPTSKPLLDYSNCLNTANEHSKFTMSQTLCYLGGGTRAVFVYMLYVMVANVVINT